jgi:hypothetical protein
LERKKDEKNIQKRLEKEISGEILFDSVIKLSLYSLLFSKPDHVVLKDFKPWKIESSKSLRLKEFKTPRLQDSKR